MTDRQTVDEMTVEELRDELRDRDLKVSGTKDELIVRLEEHEDGGEADQDAGAPSGNGSASTLRSVVDRIREDLSEVLDLEVERVTGLTRADDGWRAQVDVVEISRIPPSTDVLATYEVMTDGEGQVESYDRVARFRRSEGSER